MTATLSSAAISSKVTAYIISSFAKDLANTGLPSDTDLHALGIVNSLGLVRLVAWVGEEFGIPVAEIDFRPDQFHTIDRVVEFVVLHHGKQ